MVHTNLLEGILWRSCGWDSALPLQGSRVQSPVGELRSGMPHGTAKNIKINLKKTKFKTIYICSDFWSSLRARAFMSHPPCQSVLPSLSPKPSVPSPNTTTSTQLPCLLHRATASGCNPRSHLTCPSPMLISSYPPEMQI